jgi:uncharacterized protein (TIGR03000 family)
MMNLAILSLLPFTFLGQLPIAINYYGSDDPNSLLVVVTMRECYCGEYRIVPVPCADVKIDDENGRAIVPYGEYKTDACGRVILKNLNLARHTFLNVSAKKGAWIAPSVIARWRLLMDSDIELHPPASPSPPTLAPIDSHSVIQFKRNDTIVASDSAILAISVPRDAIVFINGKQTTSSGKMRTYYSIAMKSGNNYEYTILAQINQNGKKIEETKKVMIHVGDKKLLTFDFSKTIVHNSIAQTISPIDMPRQ